MQAAVQAAIEFLASCLVRNVRRNGCHHDIMHVALHAGAGADKSFHSQKISFFNAEEYLLPTENVQQQ